MLFTGSRARGARQLVANYSANTVLNREGVGPVKPVASEMAGILLEVKVAVGEQVEAGQEIALIESMKMHIPVSSPEGGVVRAIHAQPGQFVNAGDPILELE